MMLPYRDEKLQRRRWLVGGAFIAVLGAALCLLRLGEGLERLSFDLPFRFRGHISCNDVVVVLEDRASLDELGQKQFPPSRVVHAQLVDRLREEGAKVIVFDIVFRISKPDEDAVLAAAIKRHGNVVLGSALETDSHAIDGKPGASIKEVVPPPELLRTNAAAIGLLLVGRLDDSFGVRELLSTWRDQPTLAAAAARQAGDAGDNSPKWINFYGPSPLVNRVTLGEVLQLPGRTLPPDFFRGKIVFVGFDPSVTPASGKRDVFATPFTRFGYVEFERGYAPGTEILANSCANLMHGDALRRVDTATQATLAVLFGASAVALLLFVGRRWMLPVAAGLFIGLALASIFLQGKSFLWWNWLVLAAVQLPLAVLLGYVCPRLRRVAFISYRREGGKDFAVMIMQALRARGYDVFLDVKDNHPGEDWWEQLRAGISATPNFILILTPGMFGERKEDWMRGEILHALASNKRFVSIMPEGFAFPEDLAAELQPVKKLECITHTHAHPEMTIDKLEKFLRRRKRAPAP